MIPVFRLFFDQILVNIFPYPIKITILLVIGLLFYASKCDPPTVKNEKHFVWTRNYPKEYDGEWSEGAQGVAHDDMNWYTQERTLWKILLNSDLKNVSRNSQVVKVIDLDKVPELWDKGYDHFGVNFDT